ESRANGGEFAKTRWIYPGNQTWKKYRNVYDTRYVSLNICWFHLFGSHFCTTDCSGWSCSFTASSTIRWHKINNCCRCGCADNEEIGESAGNTSLQRIH